MSGMKKAAMFVMGIALVVAAVALTAQAQIQPMTVERSSAEVLPESTIFMFEMRDISATSERAKGNAVYNIVTDQAFKEYFSPIAVHVEGAIEMFDMELQQNLEVSLADLLQLFDGRLTLAITDFSVIPEPRVNVALLLTPSNTEHLENMLEQLIPEDLKVMAVANTINNIEAFQVGQGAQAFGWAVPDNTLVFGIGQGTVAGVLNCMAGQAGNLKENGVYSEIYERVADYDRDWLFFLNLDSPLKMVQALGGAQAANVTRQLGVDNIQGLAIAGKLEGDSVDDICYIYMPGELRGFADLISPESVNMELLNLVPAEAYQFSITRFNPGLLYDFVLDMVRSVEPDAYDEMMEAIADFEAEKELDIRDGLLGALGEELIVYELPKPTEEIQERIRAAEDNKERELLVQLLNHGYSVYMMTVDDPERLSASMDTITDAILEPIKEMGEMQRAMVEQMQADPDMQDIQWGPHATGFIDTSDLDYATETYRGVTIKYLTGLPIEDLVPAYTVTGNALILSGTLETLRKAIDMEAGGENFAGTEMWAEARGMIPDENGGFSVGEASKGVDILPIIFENFLNNDAAMLFGEIGQQMAEKDPAPMLEVVRRHSPVSLSYIRTIPGQGVEMIGRAPAGTSSLVPALVVGIGGGSAYYTYMMMQAFQGGFQDGMMMEPGMDDDWDF